MESLYESPCKRMASFFELKNTLKSTIPEIHDMMPVVKKLAVNVISRKFADYFYSN